MISLFQIWRVWVPLVAVFLFIHGAAAQTTNELSEAEIQGMQLVSQMLGTAPNANFSQNAVLKTERPKWTPTIIPVSFATFVTNTDWTTEYYAWQTNNTIATFYDLRIIHRREQPNRYLLLHETQRIDDMKPDDMKLGEGIHDFVELSGTQIMTPFLSSDFWIADLGLEFFHWPDQKILKHEDKRTRACTVLESTNPNPSPGAYSRVVSWIDNETLGIVHAEAYDADGKLLKVFDPKSFKKVNGQWELQDMEIHNVQTKSRTWIKFDLNNK